MDAFALDSYAELRLPSSSRDPKKYAKNRLVSASIIRPKKNLIPKDEAVGKGAKPESVRSGYQFWLLKRFADVPRRDLRQLFQLILKQLVFQILVVRGHLPKTGRHSVGVV